MTEKPFERPDSFPSGKRVRVSGIFLVGFMGAGKTTVGRALAQSLGWPFIDLDHRIEIMEGLAVVEIFRQHGERGFREREHQALRAVVLEVSRGMPAVVALGGGAFVQSENYELMASADRPSVFLDAPVEELWRRCSVAGEPARPLRTDPNEFRALHEKRRAHYLRSTLRVETDDKTISQIAQEVLNKLGLGSEAAHKERTQ